MKTLFVLIIGLGGGFVIALQSVDTSDARSMTRVADNRAVPESLSEFEGNDDILLSGRWSFRERATDYKLRFTVQPSDDPKNVGEVLRIFDANDKQIYSLSASSIDRIWPESVLGTERAQLIVGSINYGGSGRHAKVLDYKNGKIVDLTEQTDTLYDAFFEVVPQFHKGSEAARLPYQLLLTTPGLANPTRYTRILEFKNGQFTNAGEFRRNDAANCVDASIVRK